MQRLAPTNLLELVAWLLSHIYGWGPKLNSGQYHNWTVPSGQHTLNMLVTRRQDASM